jgi:hypothetical protein
MIIILSRDAHTAIKFRFGGVEEEGGGRCHNPTGRESTRATAQLGGESCCCKFAFSSSLSRHHLESVTYLLRLSLSTQLFCHLTRLILQSLSSAYSSLHSGSFCFCVCFVFGLSFLLFHVVSPPYRAQPCRRSRRSLAFYRCRRRRHRRRDTAGRTRSSIYASLPLARLVGLQGLAVGGARWSSKQQERGGEEPCGKTD